MPTTFELFPRATRNPATRVSPAFPVPVGDNRVTFRFGTFNWPQLPPQAPTNIIFQAQAEVSFDGGATWLPWSGCGIQGGTWINFRAGVPFTDARTRVNVPQPLNINRLVRLRGLWRGRLDGDCFVDTDDQGALILLSGHRSIVVEDAQSAQAVNVTFLDTPTITPAGLNRLMMVFGVNLDSTPAAYTSMTFGASTLTQKWSFTANYTRNSSAFEVSPLLTPAVCRYTVANQDTEFAVGAVALSGVNQGTPLDTELTFSGTTTDVSESITSESGDLVIDFLGADATSVTENQGGTEQFSEENINSFTSCGCATEAGAASVTRGWTWPGTVDRTFAMVNINAAPDTFNPAILEQQQFIQRQRQ